ncbi:helix-turn-helix domain-containing protein [Aeromonas veronii]|uniref:helix-turn-helix domain-containing protein n=1 Tax=Aeromonas veronii TaxID=654 RepID=UPI003CD0C544
MPILPPLPRPQRRRIHKIIHATRDKGHARRLMAILLLHEGRTITDVHHLTGAARSTIGRWLRWYRDEGVGALEALPAGRAPILHIPVENEHLFRFKMNADSGLRVHRFRTPQCTYSDVR